MPLGDDVRPLADGFIVSSGTLTTSPPSWDFLAHDGSLRASQPSGFLLSSANGAVLVRVDGSALVAQ